jgi:hypothetical protein
MRWSSRISWASRVLGGGALLLTACFHTTRQGTPIGGPWFLDNERTSWVESPSSQNYLRRKSGTSYRTVGRYVEEYRFYAPDCVGYTTRGADAGKYFVCGNRSPVPLPSWVLSFQDSVVRGGYVAQNVAGRMVEIWQVLPLSLVRGVAEGKRGFPDAATVRNMRPAADTVLP